MVVGDAQRRRCRRDAASSQRRTKPGRDLELAGLGVLGLPQQAKSLVGSVRQRPTIARGIQVFVVVLGGLPVVKLGVRRVARIRAQHDKVGRVRRQSATGSSAGELVVACRIRVAPHRQIRQMIAVVRPAGVVGAERHDQVAQVAARVALGRESCGDRGQRVAARIRAGGEGYGAVGIPGDRAAEVNCYRFVQVVHRHLRDERHRCGQQRRACPVAVGRVGVGRTPCQAGQVLARPTHGAVAGRAGVGVLVVPVARVVGDGQRRRIVADVARGQRGLGMDRRRDPSGRFAPGVRGQDDQGVRLAVVHVVGGAAHRPRGDCGSDPAAAAQGGGFNVGAELVGAQNSVLDHGAIDFVARGQRRLNPREGEGAVGA